jgi:hypothetical protein
MVAARSDLIAKTHMQILGGRQTTNSCPEFYVRLFSKRLGMLPTDAEVERFVEVYNARVIKKNRRPGRQLGFSAPTTATKFKAFLETWGTYLIVLELPDATPFGLGLLHTEMVSCSEEVKYIVSKLTDLGHIAGQRVGWARFGVLSKAGGRMLSRLRVRGEQLLVDVALHLAAARQLRALFSKVRVGESANVAIQEHIRCGYERTGVYLEPGEISPEEWDILKLDPYSVHRACRWERYARSSPLAGPGFGCNPEL